MKYFISLCLSLLLISCGMTGNQSPSSEQPITGAPPVTPVGIQGDYIETIENTSEKIKETQEFNSCMQSNINMCVQTTVMQVAQKNNSTEFCDELSVVDQQESCKFAVIIKSIQENGDIKLCDTLSETFQRTCLNQAYRAQASLAKDITLCDKIPVDEAAKTGTGVVTPLLNDRAQCKLTIILADPESKESDCSKVNDKSLETMCKTSLKQRIGTPISPNNSPAPSTRRQ